MIQLKGISHDFLHQGQPRRILNDIHLKIHEKEVFGLVGNTGSGKSTLLRIMNGYIAPTTGDVYLKGVGMNTDNHRQLVRKTATIFQHFNLLGNLNILDNVMLPNKLRRLDKEKSIKKAKELLQYVGLEGYESSYIKTLSGGQKQRVAIARALMSEPDIIFCDEPTSALDGEMREEILQLLRDINETLGTTIVIVSHDISVIKSMCNRAAILQSGQIQDIISIERKDIETLSYKEALLQ